LILPLLVPFVPFLVRFTIPATLIVGTIYATLKHCGLLPPEYSWPAIVHFSTISFWLPIFGGYASPLLVLVRWLCGPIVVRD
jgi:hypothetical protein